MNVGEFNAAATQTGNVTAAAATAASVMEWLPPILAAIASAFAIIWFAVEIYQSPTFKQFVAWLKDKVSK